jgi:hypothetical protein
MKHNLFPYYLILGFFFAGWLSACKDIIEPDISKQTVVLNAPGNHYQSTTYAINFWWSDVDDALKYHLQVVSPKFDSVGSLVLDTVVKSTKFTINLDPGDYEWHVRAENGSYKTAYSDAKSFSIVYTSIKSQKVQLSGPANNTVTNKGTTTFSWGSLYGATKYQVEIDTNNFIDETKLVYNQTIPGQQISFTFPKDQTYQWRIMAQNDTAQAQWSVINTVTYDHTPPDKVTLTAPDDNQFISLPVRLQWNTVPTAGTYKVYVYKSDSTTLYNSTFPATTTNTSYSLTVGTLGERIYWKVTAIDAAGNESAFSDMRSFVLQ